MVIAQVAVPIGSFSLPFFIHPPDEARDHLHDVFEILDQDSMLFLSDQVSPLCNLEQGQAFLRRSSCDDEEVAAVFGKSPEIIPGERVDSRELMAWALPSFVICESAPRASLGRELKVES